MQPPINHIKFHNFKILYSWMQYILFFRAYVGRSKHSWIREIQTATIIYYSVLKSFLFMLFVDSLQQTACQITVQYGPRNIFQSTFCKCSLLHIHIFNVSLEEHHENFNSGCSLNIDLNWGSLKYKTEVITTKVDI